MSGAKCLAQRKRRSVSRPNLQPPSPPPSLGATHAGQPLPPGAPPAAPSSHARLPRRLAGSQGDRQRRDIRRRPPLSRRPGLRRPAHRPQAADRLPPSCLLRLAPARSDRPSTRPPPPPCSSSLQSVRGRAHRGLAAPSPIICIIYIPTTCQRCLGRLCQRCLAHCPPARPPPSKSNQPAGIIPFRIPLFKMEGRPPRLPRSRPARVTVVALADAGACAPGRDGVPPMTWKYPSVYRWRKFRSSSRWRRCAPNVALPFVVGGTPPSPNRPRPPRCSARAWFSARLFVAAADQCYSFPVLTKF